MSGDVAVSRVPLHGCDTCLSLTSLSVGRAHLSAESASDEKCKNKPKSSSKPNSNTASKNSTSKASQRVEVDSDLDVSGGNAYGERCMSWHMSHA